MAGADAECILDGILDYLEAIGYSGELLEEVKLRETLEAGLQSPTFVNLVVSLCSELKRLNQMQETVSRPAGVEDAESFQLEMRGFLQELSCPHSELITSLTPLTTFSARLLLVDFLLSEMLAARLCDLSGGDDQETMDTGQPSYSVPANLGAILKVYELNAPPAHISVRQVFDKLIGKTRELVSEAPSGHITPGLVTQPLSQEQWATLDKVNEALTKEYTVRRQMLLTRCDVTIQSFRWCDRAKTKEDEITAAVQSRRRLLSPSAHVSIGRVLAAQPDLLCVQRTSSGRERAAVQCQINKVLIGKVPDRGGRPQETRPPPEMPSFKQRTEAPQEQRKGGGRGGRGGRVQGGWSGRGGGGKGKGGGRGGKRGGWDHQHSYSGGEGQGGGGGRGGWDRQHSYSGGDQQYYYS